jgi:hypothetical protein
MDGLAQNEASVAFLTLFYSDKPTPAQTAFLKSNPNVQKLAHGLIGRHPKLKALPGLLSEMSALFMQQLSSDSCGPGMSPDMAYTSEEDKWLQESIS